MVSRYELAGRGARITRRALWRGLAGACAAAAGLLVAGCGAGRDHEIVMRGQSKFEPARLTVKIGSTVTWRNASTIAHTVTTDPAKVRRPTNVRLPDGVAPWDSGPVTGGGSWSRRFDIAGEYRYCCVPHELAGMVGTLIVE